MSAREVYVSPMTGNNKPARRIMSAIRLAKARYTMSAHRIIHVHLAIEGIDLSRLLAYRGLYSCSPRRTNCRIMRSPLHPSRFLRLNSCIHSSTSSSERRMSSSRDLPGKGVTRSRANSAAGTTLQPYCRANLCTSRSEETTRSAAGFRARRIRALMISSAVRPTALANTTSTPPPDKEADRPPGSPLSNTTVIRVRTRG